MPAGDSSSSSQIDVRKVVGLLEGLVEKMGLMVDVMEKRPRSNSPSSLYFTRSYGSEQPELVRGHEFATKRFDEMSSREQRKTVKSYANEFDEKHPELKAGLEKYNKLAFFTAGLTDAEKEEYKQRYENLKRIRKERLKVFAEEQNNINAQKNIEALKAKGYKSLEDYLEREEGNRVYSQRTDERREASSAIANSGLGNSWLGKNAQTVLDTRQRADAMVNFGTKLKTGYNQQLSQQIFGNGAVAKGASKALGGFGSALTKLGGPIAGLKMGFEMAWQAAKSFADIVNKANAYINRNIKQQINLDKLAFDRDVELANLRNQMNVENIKYLGDLQLKEMEIQAENLKATVGIMTKQFVAATETAVGPLVNGINETAYSAAEKKIDLTADILKTQAEMSARGQSYELFKQRRGVEYENIAAINAAEKSFAQAKYEADAYASTMQNQIEQYYDLSGAFWSGNLKTGNSAVDWAASKVPGMLDAASYVPGVGALMKSVRGTPEEVKAQKEMTDKMSSGKDLVTGGRSQSQQEVVAQNKDKADEVAKIHANRLFNVGKDMMQTVVEQQAQQMMFGPEWEKQVAKMGADIENTVAGIAESSGNIQVETAKEVATTYIDAAANIKKVWLQLAQKTENWTEEFDTLTNNLGISLGYTTKEQLKEYQTHMFDVLEKTVSKFGKDREDMVKMQQSYVETTGRQKMLSERDYGNLFGLGKYLGDDGLATQYASEMEIFNHGASESVDLLDEALQNVNKIGLNGRKYTKDLVNNLRMAQKYNFKGGTKEFMEMAKWAQKTRFNLQSLGGIVDKIQEGGIEGVLQQSAQFQVLGGRAAMNSDPLGMLYDAWGDNFSLAKRFQDMTKGFGTLNKKTGETTFDNITENMQIAAIAKAQGRSVEEVRDEITERNKRDTVMSQLSANQKRNFDKDQLDYLGSVAKYNKEKERFEVELKSGETVGVNEISEEQLKNVMPKEHEERMETYMQQVLSAVEGVKGEEIAERANLAAATYEEFINNYLERARVAHEQFEKQRTQYIEETKAGMNEATKAFKDFIGVFNEGNSDISEAESKINAMAGKIEQALAGVADVINQATARIKQGINTDEIRKTQSQRDQDFVSKLEHGKNTQVKVEYQKNGSVMSEGQAYAPNKPKGGNSNVMNVGSYSGHFGQTSIFETKDAFIGANGTPMAISAKNVTPINDGAITSADDYGLIGENGGWVDKYTNGMHEELKNNTRRLETIQHIMPDSAWVDKFFNDIKVSVEQIAKPQGYSDSPNGNVPQGKRDVNVNINGRLTLDCGNQSIDFLSLMKADPMIVRRITEQVADQIYKNQNGGKTEGPGAGVRYSSMA